MRKILLPLYIISFIGCGSSSSKSNLSTFDENNNSREYIAPLNEDIKSLITLEENFVKRNKKSDNIQKIWNLAFKISDFKKVKKFDIGIHILKENPSTHGNILIQNILIENKKIISIGSLVIFGKKNSGSTGSISYSSDFNITKNSIKIEKDILLIQLGYMMENQTIVSTKSFKKEANYDIDIFISKLDMNQDTIDETYNLQIEFNRFYTFQKNTEKINGLIIIQ